MFTIWRLSRCVVEKVLISVLLALGLLAVGASAIKVHYVRTYDITSSDTYRQMIPTFMWSRIEELVLIIAACAPLLKAPVEAGLHRLGLPTFRYTHRTIDTIDTSHPVRQVSNGEERGRTKRQREMSRSGTEDTILTSSTSRGDGPAHASV